MKTLTFSLLFLLTTVFSFGQTADELIKDADFISYVTSFDKMAILFGERNGWDKERLDRMNATIEEAKKNVLSTDEQYALINETAQLTETDSFSFYHQEIIRSYKNLQDKYPNLQKEAFTEAAKGLVASRGCGWRYGLCSGAVAFEGGLLLAACEAASAGIATPLCLAGAVVYAANGIAECKDKYCD